MGYADPEQIVCDLLRTKLPADGPHRVRVVAGEDVQVNMQHAQRLVRVVQSPSSPGDQQPTLDIADLQIDVFAGTRDRARQLGAEVRRIMRYLLERSTHQPTGAFVTQVRVFTPPVEAPWDASRVHRRTSTYRVWIHHNPLR